MSTRKGKPSKEVVINEVVPEVAPNEEIVVVKRGRGRPPKNRDPNDPKYVKISTKSNLIPNKNQLGYGETIKLSEVRQKRKYTRRKPIAYNKTDDDKVIKPEAKKRGRKRGRKKRDMEILFTPQEVIEYIHRNYPLMGIDKISDKVVEGLRVMREFGDSPSLYYKFTYDDITYYYDDRNAILNADGQLVGHFIPQGDGNNKMYLFNRKNQDTRTFEEVIDWIENRKR